MREESSREAGSAHRQNGRGHSRLSRFWHRFRHSTVAAHSSGNRVELLESGSEFFEAQLAAIDAAHVSVLAEFYIIRDDSTGQRFAHALATAANRGVRVFLLYDFVGCFRTDDAYFRALEKAGVRCLAFNPPPAWRGIGWFDRRNHRKLVVVDGVTAFVGSMNIGDEYTCARPGKPCWRDLGVRLQGPVVGQLAELFAENWLQEGGGELHPQRRPVPAATAGGETSVLVVSGGPSHNRSRIGAGFRLAIAGAQRSVTIITPYFVPGPRLLRSLVRAARRGQRVRLVLPGLSDVPLVRVLGRSLYGALLAAGVEIFERQEAVLHAKLMVLDCTWALLGSANFDQRSLHRNFELNLVLQGGPVGERFEALVEGEVAASRSVRPEEHHRRGLLVRILEKMLSPLAWFL